MCRIFFEEQGTPVKRESTFTSSLSSKESHFNNKAFTNNDSDDIKNRCEFQNTKFELFIIFILFLR